MKPGRIHHRTRWLYATVAFLIGLGMFSCVQQGELDSSPNAMLDPSVYNDPTLTEDSPRVRLMLTDKPIDDIQSVWLTISSVRAKMTNPDEWVTVSNDVRTLDLLNLRYGVTGTLGITSLPAGTYEQLRLLVTDATVVVEGVTHPLFVPSGSTSGVKINFHFDVSDGEIATMLLDWDASASIHYAPGEGYIMRPVIHVRTFRTEDLDKVAPDAPTVSSQTHPDSDTWFAAKTAHFAYTAEDNVGIDSFSYTLDQNPNTNPDDVAEMAVADVLPEACRPNEYLGAPSCTLIQPYTATEGSLINIYGTSFGSWPSSLRVMIGANEAEIVEAHPSLLVVKVPEGLGEKTVSVTNPEGDSTCSRQLSVVSDTAFCPDGEYEMGKGLLGEVHYLGCEGNSCKLPDFDSFGEPHSTVVACQLDIPSHRFEEGFPGVDGNLLEWFAIRFTATLDVPQSGTYNFKLNSDDGSKLTIDGQVVIDNDGVHAPRAKSGSKYLSAGPHDFMVEYFQGPRYLIALQLYWTPPGGSETIIPKDRFLLPISETSSNPLEPPCFCSGHGEGAYNYRAYGVNDGDGKLYYIDIFAEQPGATEIGVLKSPDGYILSDFESLAVVNGGFYGINNSGHYSTQNRLYRILKDDAQNGDVPTEEVGMLNHNGAPIADVDCLAVSPEGVLYGISTATNDLYTIDVNSAAMTLVMHVGGEMEACAFGPSGTLYTIDNSPTKPLLKLVDIDGGVITTLSQLPWSTDVEALGWHPDGFLYAGIDNRNNSYPAIAKIRPLDGTVASTIDPSLVLTNVEGLDLYYSEEDESCSCDMDLANIAASFSGTVRIADVNGDGFSESVTFPEAASLTGLDNAADPLAGYIGTDPSCMKPRTRVSIAPVELDPENSRPNRFGLAETMLTGGFMMELLKDDCTYETVVLGDINTDRQYLNTQAHDGTFWLQLENVDVTNTIGSSYLNALIEQDNPALIMVAFEMESTPYASANASIRHGWEMIGAHSFTLQPGRNDYIGDREDLPVCPDPTIHQPTNSGQAIYPDLPDGEYFFHVKAVDDSGNWGQPSHYRILIDSTPPPAPVVTSPTHVSQIMEYDNPNPEFVWEQSDLSGISGYSFELNGDPLTIPNESIDSGSPFTGFSNMDPGIYYFHVRGVNGAGVWSQTTHFKIVVIDPQDMQNPVPPAFVRASGTIVKLGSPADQIDRFSDEGEHWVKLDDFIIMQNEVTNAEYRACVAAYSETDTACSTHADCPESHYCNYNGKCATGCERTPIEGASYHNSRKANHPVAYVNWDDAYKYCVSQGMRLPTEAEWEYAAKGADDDRFPWGDDFSADRANGNAQGLNATLAVGQFDGTKSGKADGSHCMNGRCLNDMAGNVAEWVSDFYHPFPKNTSEANPVDNPNITDTDACISACAGDSACMYNCDMKVARGGSFLSDERDMRVFFRDRYPSLYSSDSIGFRCAMDWDASGEVPLEQCNGVDDDGNGVKDDGFADTDADGLANCVDTDDDNDGFIDTEDNCPLVANSDQADPDMDGFGEACDPNGEILPVTYIGMIRPFDVAVGEEGSIYVAGSSDNFGVTATGNNEKGAVMSITALGRRSGQVQLTDTSSSLTQYEDFRPGSISLHAGYLYVTDADGAYDDGIWRIMRNPASLQVGKSQDPEDRNGAIDGTRRFWMGDPSERGIDHTAGHVIDPNGEWLYLARDNAHEVRRFPLNEAAEPTGDYGYMGQDVATFNSAINAPAMDSRGWLYFVREGRLYRQKVVDGELKTPEQISDSRAFLYAEDLEFDAQDNLFILKRRGLSNIWPFCGSLERNVVPAESGHITKVPREVLDAAHASNIITHSDETKQQLIYGGPAPIEIVYSGKRLNAPRGFAIDPANGNLIVANTESDEVVVLSTVNQQLVRSVDLMGEYDGLE